MMFDLIFNIIDNRVHSRAADAERAVTFLPFDTDA